MPRKLVITTTTDKAQPQYVAKVTWNLTPQLDDTRFHLCATRRDAQHCGAGSQRHASKQTAQRQVSGTGGPRSHRLL